MFQLNKKEWQELITICDNLPQTIKFSPALPFAFTEHGVIPIAMGTGQYIKKQKGNKNEYCHRKCFYCFKTTGNEL